MRVLVYKRTHPGDPDRDGVFGVHDCMGAVRSRKFDAVIGIGGISSEPRAKGIDRRVNWVGVGPHVFPGESRSRGPLIAFDHFLLMEEKGPGLQKLAPRLAQYMYGTNRRHVMSDHLPQPLLMEVRRILKLAATAPPSPARYGAAPRAAPRTGCAGNVARAPMVRGRRC